MTSQQQIRTATWAEVQYTVNFPNETDDKDESSKITNSLLYKKKRYNLKFGLSSTCSSLSSTCGSLSSTCSSLSSTCSSLSSTCSSLSSTCIAFSSKSSYFVYKKIHMEDANRNLLPTLTVFWLHTRGYSTPYTAIGECG